MRGVAVQFGALCAILFAGFAMLATAQAESSATPAEGVILSLNGPVTPANAGYLAREIRAASAAHKELVLIEVDTPGGLVDSMHVIVKAIRASEAPVVTFVYPEGARSASAGLYIMYAAHVSAMAPSTNAGAATPITLGGGADEPPAPATPTPTEHPGAAPPDAAAPPTAPPLGNSDALRAKQINDSVAYIRALAASTGRNADWAEKAVREAAALPASEALALHVVDVIATSPADLLAKIDGRVVTTASGEHVLKTKDLNLTRTDPSLAEKILGFLADPNVAVILMSLATTGLVIEMWNPGSILPGVMGLTSLILGLYAFQVLPFSWLGAALMLSGALFIAVEAYTPSHGLVGAAGLLLFAAGAYFVFPAGFQVSASVIGAIVVIAGGFLGVVLLAVASSRGHGPLIGAEAIRRREGVVDEWNGAEGWVIVEGERWRARSDKPLDRGDRIRVVEIDGLVLVVKPAKALSLIPSGRSAGKPAEA